MTDAEAVRTLTHLRAELLLGGIRDKENVTAIELAIARLTGNGHTGPVANSHEGIKNENAAYCDFCGAADRLRVR